MGKSYRHIYSTLLVGIGLFAGTTYAQTSSPQVSDDDIAKLESAKVGIITAKLNLTPDQAPDFWLVYNDYSAKRKQYRKSIKGLMVKSESLVGPNGKTDEEAAKDLIKRILSLRTSEAEMESEYSEKFLRFIKPGQLLKLYCAEKEVMRMLFKQMGHSHKPPEDSK